MKTADEQAAGRTPARKRSRVLLWVLVATAAAALVVAAVIGALRRPASVPPDSPEATVQGYLQAIIDRDHDEAESFLSPELARTCPPIAFREAWLPPSLTATLDEVRVRGNEAEVRVSLRSVSGPPPFGGGWFESIETFTLTRGAGGWRISEAAWPLHACGEPER